MKVRDNFSKTIYVGIVLRTKLQLKTEALMKNRLYRRRLLNIQSKCFLGQLSTDAQEY